MVADHTAREVVINPNVFEPGVDYIFEGFAFNATGESPHLQSAVWNDGRDPVVPYDPGETQSPPAVIILKPDGLDQIIINLQ